MIDNTGPGSASQSSFVSVFAPLFVAAAAAAVALRASTGRKIVGYLGAGVPVEIIEAAGPIPFRIGVFQPGLNSVQRFLEMGDSDVVAQLANSLLDGSYAFLDHVVVGNTPTFNITLFHFLRESRRLDPAFPAPAMTFHEIHHGDSETIATFNVESCRRLADQLSKIGSRITDASLLAAIERTNMRRSEITRLKTLRRQHPPCISGTEALAAITRWQLTPQVSLTDPPRQIRELPRVLFSGSDVGNFNHYPMVEAAGCTIIADDHDWSDEALLGAVATGGDAFSAIAARYANQTPRAARWSRQKRIASLVERAIEAKVDGVVFWISDEDQASSWDVPALVAALNAHGIAALDLGKQPAIGFDESTIVAKLRRWLYGLSQKHSVEVA
jgi:benzoyl-CoA reductase/2-hydroxyglutaryl-CoA dehydratase subunit BcrC/BadD/HgdB